MSARTALVTGGAGFIGSHLCESLLADGHRVVCLDNLGSGRRSNVAFDGTDRDDVPGADATTDAGGGPAAPDDRSDAGGRAGDLDDRFTFVEADVREPLTDALVPAGVNPAGVDRVYHLASRASPADFASHPVDIATTNAAGTRNVLAFAAEYDARVLYASTSEVYGDPEVHPQPEAYNGNVDPRGPRAAYDEGKRFGETLADVFHRERGVDVRTARIFNTYGPRMRPDDGRVIPTFLTQALSGRDLTVYGDGTQTRSFLYVDDQVAGLRALMDEPGMDGEVVNVGSTDEVAIRALAETVVDVTGASVGLRYEPLPHENEPRRRQPVIEKAKRELGWAPTVDLRAGLARTAAHFEDAAAVAGVDD